MDSEEKYLYVSDKGNNRIQIDNVTFRTSDHINVYDLNIFWYGNKLLYSFSPLEKFTSISDYIVQAVDGLSKQYRHTTLRTLEFDMELNF